MRARRRKSPAPRPFLCDRNWGGYPMKIWGLPFIDNLECICYKPTNCCSVIKPIFVPDFPGGVVMNKAELTARVARDTKMTKVQAARVIDSLLEHITRTLKRGERTSLVGFGTFTIAKRRARTGRNPQTGSPIQIPARRVVRVTSGQVLQTEIR